MGERVCQWSIQSSFLDTYMIHTQPEFQKISTDALIRVHHAPVIRNVENIQNLQYPR